jgi:hypothetical protein
MMDSATQQGYFAHSQNEDRTVNPYLGDAVRWDRGWVKRESEQKRHRLDDSTTDTFIQFVKKLMK